MKVKTTLFATHLLTLKLYAKNITIVILFFCFTACSNPPSTKPTLQNSKKSELAIKLPPENHLQEVTTLANSGIIPVTSKYGADGISVAKNGDIYVSSGPLNNGIVRITIDGEVSNFAKGFESANGSDFDSKGNLFVADYKSSSIKRVTPDGTVTTFASNLDGPAGVYVDDKDNVIVGLYGANYSGKAGTVLSIKPNGRSSVLAKGNGLQDVIGIVGDEHGNLYVGNYSGRELYKISEGNITLLTKTSVKINMIDYAKGYIYIANNSRIVRVNTSTGKEEMFSGTKTKQTINGPIQNADYVMPTSLAFSPDKNILYVVDQTTGDVRKISAKK